MKDKELIIRQKAYQLWEANGYPNGQDKEHWFKAQEIIVNEEAGSSAEETKHADSKIVDADFDEAWYLNTYEDVRDAVEIRFFQSGYEHYVAHGKSEGRLPGA